MLSTSGLVWIKIPETPSARTFGPSVIRLMPGTAGWARITHFLLQIIAGFALKFSASRSFLMREVKRLRQNKMHEALGSLLLWELSVV